MSNSKKCAICQSQASNKKELGSLITDDEDWISIQLDAERAEIKVNGEGSENEQTIIPINYCPACGRKLRQKSTDVELEENRQY